MLGATGLLKVLIVVVVLARVPAVERYGTAGRAATAGNWIARFCRTPGNEFFTEVPKDFIRENCNQVNLTRGEYIAYFNSALKLLLDEVLPAGGGWSGSGSAAPLHQQQQQSQASSHELQQSPLSLQVHTSATVLYGMLHARYIVSPAGMEAMLAKYKKGDFGRCPRIRCGGQHVLPVGESDTPFQTSVRVFCPRCFEVYVPRLSTREHDGVYWGTTFPHFLLLLHPQLVPVPRPGEADRYAPRIFGFRLSDSSLSMRRHHGYVNGNVNGNSPAGGTAG